MPVDKFGRMSDLKTKDTGVSLTYINNNYVRSDGETPLTGSLDMRGNTLYNVADPVNPQDVVTKVYVDNTKGSGVIGRKTKDGVSIKENLDFLGKQKIKNLPDPVNDHDVVTKEYVDTTTAPFLKLDQTKYNTKGNIDMGGQFTVLNVKTPIDDNHITNKKYVDEMDNLKSAFNFGNGEYYAKGNIYLRKNKLGGLREPLQDGEAANKKYVDNTTKNLFIDENDNIAFGLNVDMDGKKIFSLPEPEQDNEPATKKYVDDLQTHYIDKKGNIKFDRNINVGNHRIFSVKDPKKDYEATNKKYVDDSITKRLQEEKDNFLPKDPATKEYVDEAIKRLAGGDILVSKEGVFIKANGHYRATAPLDIDNHKMENLPDPVDEKDAANKKYIDGIVENLTLKQGLVRENGGFNLVDSYINMNFNNIRNVGLPVHESDATPKNYVDKEIADVVVNQQKQLNQLVGISASYCGDLVEGDYPFTFGGLSQTKNKSFKKYNGFLVPTTGLIKHFAIKPTGLKLTHPGGKDEEITKNLVKKYGLKNNPTPLYTLVLIKADNDDEEDIGTMFFYFTNFANIRITDNGLIQEKADIKFQFKPKPKYLRKDENFLCSVNEGDIINIRSEFTEEKGELDKWALPIPLKDNYKHYLDIRAGSESFAHLATLTFMFKEISFPNVLELEPLI